MSIHANCPGPGESLLVDYRYSVSVQEILVGLRQEGSLENLLWLLEHPPTITLGTSGGSDHLLLPVEDLEAGGVAVVQTPRGGDITCHEPGQLVGYPVVDLDDTPCRRDIHLYLRALEDGIIGVLGRLGLEGVRIEERTGVWIAGSAPRKIAAMGVRCNRWITSHGFALNFRNDLRGFGAIVPCGISDAGVTSLQQELPADRLPSHEELRALVHEELQRCLGLPLRLAVGGGIAELHRALREERVFEPSLSEPRGLE